MTFRSFINELKPLTIPQRTAILFLSITGILIVLYVSDWGLVIVIPVALDFIVRRIYDLKRNLAFMIIQRSRESL